MSISFSPASQISPIFDEKIDASQVPSGGFQI
jgi:hypothetical protein